MGEGADQTEEKLPPYVIEGARSGRSKCKTCRRAIVQGALRLGVLVDGRFGVGYMWHHLNCAAKRQFERVEEAYELESWNAAKIPPDGVPPLDQLRGLRDKATQEKKERKQIPYAEPAPSGRASCKQCGDTIEKGSLRVVLGREVEFGGQVRVGPINVHPGCVRVALEAEDCATEGNGLEEAIRAHSGDLDEAAFRALFETIGS